MYQTLDPDRIIATLEVLERRIDERFPKSGLARVGGELAAMARETSSRIAEIARPNFPLRVLIGLVLGLGLASLAWLAERALNMEASTELTNVMQGLDSTMSLLIVFGGAALFLSTLEGRWRRDRALKALHEFRSIVHVIDMHQLTKDPSAEVSIAGKTASSPARTLTRFELTRYLDYCAEMLSLASKVAVLYAQGFPDAVIVEVVSDLERIAAGLSQKIWQKIMILAATAPAEAAAPSVAATAPAVPR